MESYGELECLFIVEEISTEKIAIVCETLRESGFALDHNLPGYVFSENHEYPKWRSLEQAFEHVINSERIKSYGLNFRPVGSFEKICNKLSLEANLESKFISLQISEETILDYESKRVVKEKLLGFVGLSCKVASSIPVKAWTILQADSDWKIEDEEIFVKYVTGAQYPLGEIDKLITWYESVYLTRWD